MTHRDLGRGSEERPVVALRALFNAWDPIGVVPHGGLPDEYDCLIPPVLDRLAAGATADEIAAYLRVELRDHFGLDPVEEAGVEDVAARAVEVRAHG